MNPTSFRHRVFTVAVIAAALVLFAPHAQAQDMPPGMPPDIQAILQKMKSGQLPSAADMQKLKDYGAAMQATHGQTSATTTSKTGATTTLTIPCSVISSESWNHTYGTGKSQTRANGNISVYCQAQMVVSMHGNGDYFKNQFNPNIGCSMFQIQPFTDAKGQPAGTGGGSAEYHSQSDDVSEEGDGQAVGGAACSGYLTSTGSDALFINFQIGGDYRGTIMRRTKDKTTSQSDMLIPGLTCPLPQAKVLPKIVVGQKTPQPMMQFSYTQLAGAVKSGKTTVLQSGASFDYELGTPKNPDHWSGSSSLSITINPLPEKMIIEPGQPEVYEKWLPEPDSDSSGNTQLFGDPKPISIHVAMLKANGPPAPGPGPTKPTAPVGGIIDLRIQDVSDAKGVCMNYPKNASMKKSLYFPQKQPVEIKYIDDQHVQTIASNGTEAWALVACRDTAAYGTVTAECETQGMLATYPRTMKQGLPLPMDDNNNHIADAWEKDNNVYDDNYPADWDDEDKPSGWKTQGDGITLFEEYRGFLVEDGSGNEVFRRLSPEHKKLFVFLTDADKPLHLQGTQLYQQITGVEPLIVHSTARMDTYESPLYPNWINFNTTPYSKTKQCAVWIDDQAGFNPGTTLNAKDYPQTSPQCPQTTVRINVSRLGATDVIMRWASQLPPRTPLASVSKGYQNAAKETGLDLTAVGNATYALTPQLVRNLIVFCTAHELGHATGARHHALDQYMAFNDPSEAVMDAKEAECFSSGDRSCPMRYWHFDSDKSEILLFMSGKWNLMAPAAGGAWTFCDADLPNMRIKP